MNRAKSSAPAISGAQAKNAPVAVKLLLAAVSILISFLLLEGAVRLLHLAPAVREIGVNIPDSIYRRCANPILGYELRPGARTLKSRVNSQGMFGVERPVRKPEGLRRILLLGDSILEPDDKTADELMNARLEKLYPPGTTEVLNLGVGGYNTLMEVERLKVRGLPYEPDVVVMIFVENDFDNIACERAVLSEMSRPAWVNWGFRHSQFFRLLCLKLDWFGFRADTDPISRGLAAIGTNNVARALPFLKELSVKHRFQTWIAIWPRFEDNYVTNVHYLGEGRTLVIEALAQMSDIPTCRLSEYFNSNLKSRGQPINPRQDLTYGDGMHPKAEGVRLAAQALKSMLDAAPPVVLEDPSLRKVKADAAARAAQALGIQGVDHKAALLQYGKWMEESAEDPDHLSKAVSYYEAVLQIDADNFEAHSRLGRVFHQLGNRGQALIHLQRALAVRPNDPGARQLIQEMSSPLKGSPAR
jgi:hypothetical protein